MGKETNAEIEKSNKRSASKSSNNVRLPAFLELVFNLSNLILLMVPLLVAGLSYVSGANLVNIVIRTAAAIIVTGIFLYIIARRIVSETVDVTNQMLEEASKKETKINGQISGHN